MFNDSPSRNEKRRNMLITALISGVLLFAIGGCVLILAGAGLWAQQATTVPADTEQITDDPVDIAPPLTDTPPPTAAPTVITTPSLTPTVPTTTATPTLTVTATLTLTASATQTLTVTATPTTTAPIATTAARPGDVPPSHSIGRA
jgi:hypothetical protein